MLAAMRSLRHWILYSSSPVVVLFGLLGWAAVLFISHTFSSRLAAFRGLSRRGRFLWHMTVLRGIYGLFASAVGVRAAFFDDHLAGDVVLATNAVSRAAILLSGAFFLLEASLITVADIVTGEASWLMRAHLWLAMANFLMVAIYQSIHFFSCVSLLLEISSPFSSLSWLLHRLGWGNSLGWRLNQFFLLHTFHLRSVIECYLFFVTYRNWDRVWTKMPLPIFVTLYGQLLVVTFVMTPYWTYRQTLLFAKKVSSSASGTLYSRRRTTPVPSSNSNSGVPSGNFVPHSASLPEDRLRLKSA